VTAPDHVVPWDRLPDGFAGRLEAPPDEPAEPRPAATIALIRPGSEGVEVLLLRRSRTAGFVPGAWVFPGGRVDGDDATPALLQRLEGLDADGAARRLALPPDADPPAVAYFVAAVREAFEETGILVGRTAEGPPPTAARDPEVDGLRERILDDEDAFPEALDRMGASIDGGAVEYIAHWITPEVEPRRYDTRFFAAAVPAGSASVVDPREMTDAVWLEPEEALARHREGRMPMIFPTLHTLERLRGHRDPDELLASFGARSIPTILPRLVRTEEGLGTVIP